VRLDLFLRNSGIVPRRSQAQKVCKGGLVEIDGRTAKASSSVEIGQEISVQLGMSRRRYRVLDTPERPVSKQARSDVAELLESNRAED
jgi:ribosomal 50S subunit-recycling heat shock protein